ncbi:hypothetical protein GOP47_0015615 [Adiantum capillus-veneris]|uniref:Secreted protein n=1 Tax=Adiantum capillus-veneris TaxID=13818 RepID=A0A9D4UKN8_ADICA|nr:hypothetical protein GOP47_0015615 [Adiantum capillus-veneris]
MVVVVVVCHIWLVISYHLNGCRSLTMSIADLHKICYWKCGGNRCIEASLVANTLQRNWLKHGFMLGVCADSRTSKFGHAALALNSALCAAPCVELEVTLQGTSSVDSCDSMMLWRRVLNDRRCFVPKLRLQGPLGRMQFDK